VPRKDVSKKGKEIRGACEEKFPHQKKKKEKKEKKSKSENQKLGAVKPLRDIRTARDQRYKKGNSRKGELVQTVRWVGKQSTGREGKVARG